MNGDNNQPYRAAPLSLPGINTESNRPDHLRSGRLNVSNSDGGRELAKSGRRVGHVVAFAVAVDDIAKLAEAAQGVPHHARMHAGSRGHIPEQGQSLAGSVAP